MSVEIVVTSERCEEIIDELEAVSAVSVVSMILPPNSNLVHTKAMMANELITATRIRDAELIATIQRCIEIVDSLIITSARTGIRRTGTNGVAIFVGGGLEHVFNVSAVPFDTSLYIVDNRFHTHAIPRLIFV
jgi:peptide subunit release factor 1 (eRF1)